jgi:CubicO group peptidase (beta-lactamase class C family)
MRKAGLFLLLLCHQYLFAQVPYFIKDSLDSYVKQGMKDWNVPGLSIVIVKDGKVVVMKGYGVRDIQTHKPVDENTLFMIASNTNYLQEHRWLCLKPEEKFR